MPEWARAEVPPLSNAAKLPSADSRRDLVLRSIDEAISATKTGVLVAEQLEGLSRHSSESVRSVAVAGRATVQRILAPRPGDENDLLMSPVFEGGRKLDDWFTDSRSTLHRPFRRIGRVMQPSWVWIGLILTLAIGAMIIAGAWWGAVTLLVFRVLVSIAVGEASNLPYEGASQPGPASAIIYRCMAGHVSDLLLLGATAIALSLADQVAWAMATLFSALVMLLATLLRVSSLQVGVQIHRLTLERVVRVGGLAVGLLLVAVGINPWATLGFPTLALCALGCLLYGVCETIRVIRRLIHADKVYGRRMTICITVSTDPTESHPVGVFRTLLSGLDRVSDQEKVS